MIDAHILASRDKALRQTFQQQLGVKSRDLPEALRRAGRRLPRRIRQEGAFLVNAQKLAGNPKLARQINPSRIDHAFDAIHSHLEAIDVTEIRKGKWLGIGGTLALNLLIVVAAFLVWLWWRGYV